jgi:glycosyltransferase involved in cell wall biosynthesis
MPSRKEGFSYMLLEASLAELPIIATSAGGSPEIIENEKTGLVVPTENEIKLEEAIRRFLDNHELAQKLGLEARKKVQKDFTIEKMRENTYSLYRKN